MGAWGQKAAGLPMMGSQHSMQGREDLMPARVMLTVGSCAGAAQPPPACARDSRPPATAPYFPVAAQDVSVAAPTTVLKRTVTVLCQLAARLRNRRAECRCRS